MRRPHLFNSQIMDQDRVGGVIRQRPDRLVEQVSRLGAAQYRAGQYEEALVSLNEAQALGPRVPANLAFLAMAHRRLGQTDQARSHLAQLRTAMQSSQPQQTADTTALLREVEVLIEGKAPSAGR
jgi:hypothetical protein